MKSSNVALSGVLLALNMILLFGATMLPGIELTLFAVSSFLTALVLMKTNPGGALVFFGASSALGLLILPGKLALLPYLFFFGYYGIVKYFIEKSPLGKKPGKAGLALETMAKLLVFLAALAAGLLIFQELFFSGVKLPDYPVPILALAAASAFVAYDYIFTLVIGQFRRYFKN